MPKVICSGAKHCNRPCCGHSKRHEDLFEFCGSRSCKYYGPVECVPVVVKKKVKKVKKCTPTIRAAYFDLLQTYYQFMRSGWSNETKPTYEAFLHSKTVFFKALNVEEPKTERPW